MDCIRAFWERSWLKSAGYEEEKIERTHIFLICDEECYVGELRFVSHENPCWWHCIQRKQPENEISHILLHYTAISLLCTRILIPEFRFINRAMFFSLMSQ